MAWAPTHKVVLGCIAFVVFWVLAVFPAVPFLPIGRTAGSVLGGVLMVVFQVISPNQAFDAVDLPILGLLFGTMVVSVYLERADLFKYLGSILSWRSRGGKDLLCRVCLLSAISSALFTNDTTCVVFTEFVLKLCKQHNLPALPFLMALATSSNIGSAATAIGNPQNLVIAVQSKISFGKFLIGVFPAMALGIVVNTVLLLLFYWKSLTHHKAEKDDGVAKVDGGAECDVENPKTVELGDKPRKSLENFEDLKNVDLGGENPGGDKKVARDGVHSGRVQPVTHEPALHEEGNNNEETEHSPAVIDDLLRLETRRSSSFSRHRYSRSSSRQGDTIAPVSRSNSIRNTMTGVSRSCSQDLASIQDEPAAAPPEVVSRKKILRRKVWKISVYLVTVAMLAALLYGLNLSWCAMTAAVVLMVLDFSDAGPALDQVSYSLLVFFSGMFITVDGFNRTGAPGQLWNAVEPHARISSVSGVALLSLVVILLSNVASNVPTVLLLGARVAASAAATHGASVTRAWLMLAWVSTVAGNLTLVGSAANLIVSEQGRRAESVRYNLSFWSHLRFGVPSTFIVIAVGLPLIQG